MVDERICTPLLSIRAMLCIKLMVNIHCSNRAPCGAHLPQIFFFFRIPSITIQRYATYFFYCIFFKHVHISVLSLFLFVGVCIVYCISSFSPDVVLDVRVFQSLSLMFYSFALLGQKKSNS